jgi:DNA-binding transcriptional MerR regulator
MISRPNPSPAPGAALGRPLRGPTVRVRAASSISVGSVARLTGMTIRAIRFYEERGLVNPSRDAKGLRRYDREMVDRLLDIGALRAAGLSLLEIAEVLDDAASGDRLAELLHNRQQLLARQLDAIQACVERIGAEVALPPIFRKTELVSVQRSEPWTR